MRLHEKVAKELHKAGGRVFLVGGAVRDQLLGLEPKDFDLEVFGLDAKTVSSVLAKFGKPEMVGKDFSVFKVGDVDVALPRREKKVATGHGGFEVVADPFMSVREAASRRDLTVNALMVDMDSGELVDPFGGAVDLQEKVLRHVGPRFAEDPLRVFRAAQFAARFDFDFAAELLGLCRTLAPSLAELPKERVGGEFHKLLVKGVKPSKGLKFLRDVGALVHFPELLALVGCEQDPGHHPEGDVFEHTCHVLDFAASLRDESEDPAALMFAALCHDLGKPAASFVEDGKVKSPGHAAAGVPLAKSLLARLDASKALVAKVLPLVAEHMSVHAFGVGAGPAAARRLVRRLGDVPVSLLLALHHADHAGRPPKSKAAPAAGLRLAELLADVGEVFVPLVLGRDVLALGVAPGPVVGELLRKVEEAQLSGEVEDRAQAVLLLQSLVG